MIGYENEHEPKTDWPSLLDEFGRRLIQRLQYGEDARADVDPWYAPSLPSDRNPITDFLRKDPLSFVASFKDMPGWSLTALAKATIICQMQVFDAKGGPDGDRKPKMSRRHWYNYFKVQFAQPLSTGLGEDFQELKWTGLMSRIYGWFVDTQNVTYLDLWVKDDSRMVSKMAVELYRNANILFAVEKDSLFADFEAVAKALGARAILSGKGKNSKAATERVLREYFGWSEYGRYNYETESYEPVFTYEDPLVIIHVTDFDYDGEQVIGPTFGQQARRYTNYVVEARIGIEPVDVRNHPDHDLEDTVYQVKLNNKGYITWAASNALFWATCVNCDRNTLVQSLVSQYDSNCPHCGGHYLTIEVSKEERNALGLEVEALPIQAYRELTVKALLEAIEYDYIIQRLREDAVADPWEAVSQATRHIQNNNESYQRLMKLYGILQAEKEEFENTLYNDLYNVAEHQKDLFDWQGETPDQKDFVRHVVRDSEGPWRPFSTWARTELLGALLLDEAEEYVTHATQHELTWDLDEDDEDDEYF